MSPLRDPLSSRDLNTPFASSSSTSRPKKLAPIFTRSYKRPTAPHQLETPSSAHAGPSKKRARYDTAALGPRDRHHRDDEVEDALASGSEAEEEDMDYARRIGKLSSMSSVQDWFTTTTSDGYLSEAKDGGVGTKRVFSLKVADAQEESAKGKGWVRRRKRFGMRCPGGYDGFRGDTMMSISKSSPLQLTRTTPYLQQLVHCTVEDFNKPPNMLLIPSIHPWNYPRDHAPALALNYSRAAKMYDAESARAAGVRRLIAVAAEEGGVRVVDSDEPLGMHRDAKGWFWRAHGNAVLDIKWTPDDRGLLTASGDQTARIHALDGSTPTLKATLKGHTGSVKTCSFMDLSRSYCDLDNQSTVVTGSRDGHIMFYDVRAPGKRASDSEGSLRRSPRHQRYSNGIPGFEPQTGGEIGPVLEILNAHGDGSKKRSSPKVITSLVCLNSMPGYIASAGSADGIVKLWDPRNPFGGSALHPQPTATLPDPVCLSNRNRSRGINAMVEQPNTGDLFVLTGDSRISVLRPSAASSSSPSTSLGASSSQASDFGEAIQPVQYTHPLFQSNFWCGLSFSSCGRYLASGSQKGGLMTWDTTSYSGVYRGGVKEVLATRLSAGDDDEREINAVDWGHDMVAACCDDAAVRLWRRDDERARAMRGNPSQSRDWVGYIP